MKKYQIIYADPPWDERGGGKCKRGADKHYPLMKTSEIMALHVKAIAADNAHLYLWTTNYFFPDALKVVKAWGFRYITTITWAKPKFGLGQYFRGQTEHCLFATRGRVPYKTLDNWSRCQSSTLLQEQQDMFSEKKEHSEKPDKMRKVIEFVSDREGFNKIELFARKKTEGWDTWGNEVDNDITL